MHRLHRPDPTPIDRALMGELGLYGDDVHVESSTPILPIQHVTKRVVVVVNGVTITRTVNLIQSTNPNTRKAPQ